MNKEIAGLGAVVVDTSIIIQQYPEENDKVRAESDFEELGGPVPTALTYLSNLGWRTRLAAAVGDDYRSFFIENRLGERGVDTRYLVRQAGKRSGVSQIWISKDTGARTLVSSAGTLRPIESSEISDEFFQDVQIFHMDGHEPVAAANAADRARSRNITVTLDAGTYKPESEHLIAIANIVQVPLRHVRQASGIEDMQQAAQYIRSKGPEIAVVTDGENGLAYSCAEGTFYLPSYPIEAVDTNGAGDIFSGAMVHAIASNMPVHECMPFASAAAALTSMYPGKSYLPSSAEVKAFVNSYR